MGLLSNFIASIEQLKRGFGLMSSTLLFASGVIITFVGIGLMGYGIFRILDTTPFMGIMVDAQGNPLPIEGYPLMWVGLAISGIGSILCFIAGYNILQRREDAVISRLINAHTPNTKYIK
jgi:hypothetical protein